MVTPFWICEHTNLIQAVCGDGFPRFMKWNISKLVTKIRAVDIEQPHDVEIVVGDLHMSHSERRFMKTKNVMEIGAKAEYSNRSGVGRNIGSTTGTNVDGRILGSIDGISVHGLDNIKQNVQNEGDVNRGGVESNDQCARCASTSEEYQRALVKIGVLEIELQCKSDVIFALETELTTMRATYEEKCRKLEHEIAVTNNQKECDIERMRQLVDELNNKNTKLVKQLDEYTVHKYTQAVAGVQEMKQSNEEMYHCEANILAIMPVSTSFPSDMNEKTELQGMDTRVTPINNIRHVACDVDLMAGINQNTGTTAL